MLKSFKLIALFEGISLLSLLFFAMPLKYFLQQPLFVKIIGMFHGILFILYVIMAFFVMKKLAWSYKTFVEVLIASLIPGGTFYIDKKYLN